MEKLHPRGEDNIKRFTVVSTGREAPGSRVG